MAGDIGRIFTLTKNIGGGERMRSPSDEEMRLLVSTQDEAEMLNKLLTKIGSKNVPPSSSSS